MAEDYPGFGDVLRRVQPTIDAPSKSIASATVVAVDSTTPVKAVTSPYEGRVALIINNTTTGLLYAKLQNVGVAAPTAANMTTGFMRTYTVGVEATLELDIDNTIDVYLHAVAPGSVYVTEVC